MTPEEIIKKNSLIRLRKSWFAYLVISTSFLVSGYNVLRVYGDVHIALHWLGISSFALILFMVMLYNLLQDNFTKENHTFSPVFGPGTNLTIIRGILIAMLIGFAFSSRPDNWIGWMPGCLFTLAILADYFDGYLARLSNHTTCLGEKLDTNLDGWTILAGSMLLIQYGQAPWWFIFVGLARFIFLGGIWIRQRCELPVYQLEESVTRRAFAGVQMGLIAVLLLPVFSPPGTYWAATLFAIPFIIGFLLDWMSSIGLTMRNVLRIIRLDAVYSLVSNNAAIKSKLAFVKKWSSIFLRASIVFLIITTLWSTYQESLITTLIPTRGENPTQIFVLTLMMLLMLLGLFGQLLGVAGRVAALGVLFAVGIRQHLFALNPLDILLIINAIMLFYLGTGPGSLWQPENQLIYRRAGQSHKHKQVISRKNEGEAWFQKAV
jgi:CDP-diacylglycerol---glycerol-3-phosphate 3-phosphatidyltransferase